MTDTNNKEALKKISEGRKRENLLRKPEQNLIAYLVQRIPQWITSDMLTAIGFLGSIIVFAAFILGKYLHTAWLLLTIFGFIINWFGDSLDGRLAYYRNKSRKWYGFSLDIIADWLTDILIGLGYMIYVASEWSLLGYGFVTLYGWAMMMALLRYKITNVYKIDSGYVGPTEVRIIICFLFVLEVIFNGAIIYIGLLVCILLLFVNIKDFIALLKVGDQRDKEERAANNKS